MGGGACSRHLPPGIRGPVDDFETERMSPCDPAATFRGFGESTTSELLESAAKAMSEALKSPHPEAVHKMRVSIRRFQQSLRLFSKFLKKRGVREVRRELKTVMDPAGQLRNYDIAIGLVRRAKADTSALRERRLQ